LSRPKLKRIDTLVLACTHYPLIRKEIDEYYHQKINIVDSAGAVAQEVKKVLVANDLMSKGSKVKHHFFVSDFTKSYEVSTKLFFGSAIHLEEKNIWS
jgi:glutamate racemase